MSLRTSLFKLTVSGLFASLLGAGCSSLPSFDRGPGTPLEIAPTVSALIIHIQCEIRSAFLDPDTKFDDLRKNPYVAYAILTLDVTNNQGVTPTLSFIHPYSTPSTSFTALIGGQVTGTQHRNINQTFTLELAHDTNLNSDSVERQCRSLQSTSGLRGDLGLKEILASGVRQNSDEFTIFPLLQATSDKDSTGLSASLVPNFGSTIDFTVIYGVNGGPTWTLTHFVGPNGSSGLANYTRTLKDTLVIAFARVPVAPRAPGESAPSAPVRPARSSVEQAGRAAQDQVTRMILQRLLPFSIP